MAFCRAKLELYLHFRTHRLFIGIVRNPENHGTGVLPAMHPSKRMATRVKKREQRRKPGREENLCQAFLLDPPPRQREAARAA